jgi:hypothetical protein
MLESLAMQDETVIREEAVASINHIAQKMTDKQIMDFIIPMIFKVNIFWIISFYHELSNENNSLQITKITLLTE